MNVSGTQRQPRQIRSIVSDTGPLISLERLTNGFRWIRRLHDRILVPPAVINEITAGWDDLAAYLEYFGIGDLIEVSAVPPRITLPEIRRLHEGEIQAIQLAKSLQRPLLIEEATGRRSARAAGVAISGIAGQIVAAHRQGFISLESAQAMLKEMLEHHRINARIHERLTLAMEQQR